MRILRFRYVLALLAVIIVASTTIVPAVPFGLTVHNPGFPYTFTGYDSCSKKFGNSINITNEKAWNECLKQYLIPPINVTGYGSLSFSLFGVGLHPFPDILSVGENGFQAILHMSGAKIAAAEGVPQSDVIYNPQGISISNQSLSLGFLGRGEVNVSVTNLSGQTMMNPIALVSVPGDSGNYTDKYGIHWMYTLDAPATPQNYDRCLVGGRLQNVTSGSSCSATLKPIIVVSPNSAFIYSVEVRGYLGTHYFITKQSFSYSSKYVNQAWITEFIRLTNSARNGPALVESLHLDAFAVQRFNTAVKQPDISDYGLPTDMAAFFGANVTNSNVVELLFYPSGNTPYSYQNTLQQIAPGHWATLTNVNYTHYGYYVGTGPYEIVKLPCPITEIPRAGINITQFFTSAGCSVSLEQATWLVMILSS